MSHVMNMQSTGLDQPTLERIEAVPESKIPTIISSLECRFNNRITRDPRALHILFDYMGVGSRGYLLGWVLALQLIGESLPEDLA